MRIRIYETPTLHKEFFTMKEASTAYGKSIYHIKKKYKIERIYEVGYWNDVDKEYLKAVAVKRYETPRCLII